MDDFNLEGDAIAATHGFTTSSAISRSEWPLWPEVSRLFVEVDGELHVAEVKQFLNSLLDDRRDDFVVVRIYDGYDYIYHLAVQHSIDTLEDGQMRVALALDKREPCPILRTDAAIRRYLMALDSESPGGVVVADGRVVGVIVGSAPEITVRSGDFEETVSDKGDISFSIDGGLEIGLIDSRGHMNEIKPIPKLGVEESPIPDLSPQPPTVALELRADMPEVLKEKQWRRMTVQISREQLELLAEGISGSAAFTARPDQELVVQLMPKLNLEVETNNQWTTPLPAPGQSIDKNFKVRGTHAGEGELQIFVSQAEADIAVVTLRPEIVAEPKENETRLLASATLTSGVPRPPLQLVVMEQRNGSELRFQYLLQGLGVNKRFESAPLTEDRQDYVNGIYKSLESGWSTDPEKQSQFRAYLKARGIILFEQLFPPDLQRLLWRRREEIKEIKVLSFEPFIPWEIVHLREPTEVDQAPTALDESTSWFLGEMGLIRWLEGLQPPSELKLRPDHVFYLVPTYPGKHHLPAAATEGETVRQLFQGAQQAPTTVNGLRDFFHEPGTFDLFHFAGHGIASSGDIMRAGLVLGVKLSANPLVPPTKEMLDAGTLSQFAAMTDSAGHRPIVALNACQLGRLGESLNQMGGFAQACLKGGAGVFVGGLWAVADFSAKIFFESFYGALLSDKTLSEAAVTARAAASAADPATATHLAYSIYGDPGAKLRVET